MKSTQAMRDRIRELMTDPQDDYDRAIECVLDDLELLIRRSSIDPFARDNRSYEPVEKRAKEIYDALPFDSRGPYDVKPPWQTGGNSIKQDQARESARNELRASADSSPVGNSK
jgi:hypothetical protein